MRIAWSRTLGYARPDPGVVALCEAAALRFEEIGCIVEEVDQGFKNDPADIWTAEFYAGVGTRLKSVLEQKRALLDPAVADILDAALSQEMEDYYVKVFARYALRDEMRAFFERFDLLLSPVLPVSSLDVGRNIPDHLGDRNLVSWIFYTYPANLIGHPAGAVCVGVTPTACPSACRSWVVRWANTDVVRAAAAVERAFPKDYNLRKYHA